MPPAVTSPEGQTIYLSESCFEPCTAVGTLGEPHTNRVPFNAARDRFVQHKHYQNVKTTVQWSHFVIS